MALGLTPAFADIVTNTVTSAGENSITKGGTTSIGYVITNVNRNAGDTQNSCNPSDGGATLTVHAPAAVSVSPASRTYSGCDTAQYFDFSSTVVGNHSITVTIADATGTYDTAPATFTLMVKAPLVTNTAPRVSVSGVAATAYEFGNVPDATCNVADTEDGPSSFPATLSAITGPRAAEGLGSQSANCTYTDTANGGGLTTSATTAYTIVDTTKPLVTVPSSPVTVEATGRLTPVEFAVTAQDAVDGTRPTTCKNGAGTVFASGSSFAVGITTLVCTATDKAGNIGTSDPFSVAVSDTTAPRVQAPANMVVANTSGTGATVAYSGATATDLVDGPLTPTCAPGSGTAFTLGTTTVTCTATDAAGNTGRATFTIEVQDRTKPDVTVPANRTVEATSAQGATVTYSGVSAVDDVDGPIAVTCDKASGTVFRLGTTTVTCSATDSAGNTADNSFIITVQDTTAPAVQVPANLVREATSAAGAAAAYTVSATDAVTDPVEAACDIASGSTFPLGTATVTCSATDAAGNTGRETFTVTVRDTTAPRVTVSADLRAEATGPGGARVAYDAATAVDIVDGEMSPSCSKASDTVFALGTTTVTCAAIDAANNRGTASFTVTVVDTTAPRVQAPANMVVGNTSPTGASGVTYTGATAEDLVDGVLIPTCSPASGGAFPLGITTVTCTATDAAGNTGEATFTIEVQDQTKPEVTVPADIVEEATGPTGARIDYFGVTATDDVDGPVTATCSKAAGTVFSLGTTTVTCSATDRAGNKGDNTFTVTVRDTLAPALTVSANKNLIATSANGATVTYPAATATDLVDGTVPATCDKASGSVFPLGTTTVTCTATDAAGNSGTKQFTVTVSYGWSHVLQPINVDGSSIFKLGSTVPVKFQLTGASAGITNAVARLYYMRVTSSGTGTAVEAISTSAATTGNLFRYDPTSDQYVFNFATRTLNAGTYKLRIDLGDGITRTVNVTLR